MAFDIRVPEFGESVSEAVVGRWLKKEGEAVAIDEPVVELETDKVAVEVTAEQAGTLAKITQAEGATVSVGDILATITEGAPVQLAAVVGGGANPVPEHAANGAASAAATPVARRVADEHDVDLGRVSGTGPGGRVTKGDITDYLSRASLTESPALSSPPAGQAVPTNLAALFSSPDREERVRISRRRQTIATRLVEAQHTAAMLTTFNEIDMSAVMEVRKRRRDSFKERNGVGLGFMSFFTKAAVGALKAFPRLNAEIQGDEFVLKKHYDIGIAVGAEEGLIVPVLRDADRKSFAQIEREIVDMATRARENKLTLPELQGGTFTLTNGGVFGSLLSTPILNAPEVGILGMHKIQERAVVVDGQIVVRPMMYLALSYDHRIVDGREAVQFLVRIKELMETPETLLLEG